MKYLPFLLLLVLGCRETPRVDYQAEKAATYTTAAIAGPHPLATQAGLEILRRGGNAIDAAVTMQLAMAVVYPRAGNIGGGGFLVYRAADGEAITLDYREVAPAAAHRDMYLDGNGEVTDGLSTRGHLAVGVPGTVAGIAAMHERFGSLPWAELVQPAIDLAADGYRLSEAEIGRLKRYHDDFAEFNDATPFSDSSLVAGTRVQQPDLAATLTRIQAEGRDGFYRGETADLIVAEMESGGGLITNQDLSDYQPKWKAPITQEYQGYRLISMPPSSSGGIALGQMAKMVEPYPLAEYGFQSVSSVQVIAEAMRRAYADRAEYLGDADFYPVPVDSLLNDGYLRERMADFTFDTAGTSTAILAGDLPMKETFETTHISIVDSLGNAVSITTTLNGNFGSKVMVDGGGFFLNNEMDDFSAKPGVPNMFGLVGKEANAIQPGKRMLSSMTPTIVEKDGQLFMVLGAPGGSTIITAVLQTFLNVVAYGMDLPEAVAAPRFHHQWLPDEILYESEALSGGVKDSLEALGYRFREVNSMAVIKAIQSLPDGRLQAAADPRNPDDDVAGY
ncbi:gamma-glutamyltranspeptidase/glutathione hydrolase [Lewinella marina]|uniref:Glutathione hydrolase proenzyme n=1 Tax=Neolewinella marina TaxID=438751 RepID=A0A2G0CHY0_9BACT|nr:gamma-glutamyltransferase [Neolewinella marina]NJB85300.1 gamma-glutamyltranspeptidase/glutathione hydrolase [Neolewinella marina]PHK99584.1 gamma-glutamyltransferase [Neolewinella marina]